MEKNKINWPGWEVVRLIGRGSFGEVYEIQRKIFEDVEKAALKVISIPQNESDIEELYADGYDDESITSTFDCHLRSIVAEYSLMKKMNGNTNIVNCDDVRYIQHDNGIGWDIFIKMELLTPLTKSLPNDIDENTVIKIGIDMCSALELCKKHEIVHRDIKPQNIFVSENGDYKLGDFGIAKTVEKTMGGTKIGTYRYMAPEVYNNKPYGTTADIYSLGLNLYWLLNERRMPFLPLPPEKIKPGMEEEARNRRLQGEQIPKPAHGSEELKEIVLKACAYDSKDRYQNATELKQDLEKCLGIIPVQESTIKEEVVQEKTDDIPLSIYKNIEEEPKNIVEENREETETKEIKSEIIEEKVTKKTKIEDKISTDEKTSFSDEKTDKKPKRKKIKIVFALILVLSLIICLVQCSHKSNQKSVPNVIALSEKVAKETLENFGFKVEVKYTDSETVDSGKVIKQSPSQGEKVEKGDTVTIEVSKGKMPSTPESFSLPDVVGKSETEAKSTLENLGLKVEVKYSNSDKVPSKEVIKQSPSQGEKVAKGDTVTIEVSKGKKNPTEKPFSLPNVVGKSESAAKSTLVDLGLKVEVKYSDSDTVPSGEVIKQNPSNGTNVTSGDTVTITVSKGKNSFTVPNVIGKNLSKAKSTLEGKGLIVKVQYVENCEESKDIVLKQSPSNSVVVKGDKVTLTVNKGGWSDYMETLPSYVNSKNYKIETLTKYSYRDKEYTTSSSSSLSGWTMYKSDSKWSSYGSWSSWQDGSVSASNSRQVETRTVWGYYYFKCPHCGAHMHGYGTCYTWAGGCGRSTTSSGWVSTMSTISWNNAGLKEWHGTGKYYTTALDGSIWFKWPAGGSKTQYRYRDRSLIYTYYYWKWGNWSSFSTTKVTSSDTREVRTKTYYRYSKI